ncbi:hypothetical protein NQZ68_002015 [Dissostichus eleginoides]|nr:hypothetical protein NQZ68_002015 [Dissostichus eleginoides]
MPASAAGRISQRQPDCRADVWTGRSLLESLLKGVVTDASPQTVAPSSQEVAGQQQQIQVDSSADHVPAYSYQSK